MTTKITASVIEPGAISTASLADTSITAAKLAGTLDLTGKTVTVATATAGDNDTTVASTAFVSTAIANLTDSAPAALDTLNELAAALNDDADFSTTVTNSIALKAPLASPTFTGDATFDTDTLVIDSTNNRVGIGTTSPDVKLHLEDASRVDIKFEKTGSETHYIRKDGDFLRFRGHDDNTVLFELKNNTNGLNVCSFPAGNVGIGTTNQIGEKLTVNGSVQVLGNNDPNYSAKFISAYDSTHGLRITTRLNDVTESEILGVYADSGGASPRLVLNPTNGWKVGIGTTSPATTLSVKGTVGAFHSNNDNRILMYNNGTVGSINVTYGTVGPYLPLTFLTGDTERMRIDIAGRVGIGAAPQTAPYYNNDNPVLTVHKASGNAILPIVAAANSSSAILHLNQAGNRYWRMSAISGGSLTFGGKQPGSGAAESEAMRITSNGAIKMPSSVFSLTDKYNLFTNDQGGEFVQVLEHSNTSAADGNGPHGMQISFTGVTPNQTNRYFFRCGDTTALRIIIDSQGNITNQNGSYGQISDEKLKENIVDASPKLDELMQLEIKNFNFIGDDKKQLGVIAQQVETIFPNLIDERKDTHPTTNEDLGTTTKSVKYSVFVPMLIKAMQEQQTIIEDLKSRITTLEG